jgi:hypothetical protein
MSCSCSSGKYSGRKPLVGRKRARGMLDDIALASDGYVRRNSPDPLFGSTVSRRKPKSRKTSSPSPRGRPLRRSGR